MLPHRGRSRQVGARKPLTHRQRVHCSEPAGRAIRRHLLPPASNPGAATDLQSCEDWTQTTALRGVTRDATSVLPIED
jgi:hypothetical protein